jgi:glycerophosphoryl diester phosphodiesterase
MQVFHLIVGFLLLLGSFSCTSSRSLIPAQQWSTFQPEQFAQFRLAHRGGYAHGPENAISTMVHNLVDLKVNALEVDLRLTRDNHLVVFHDETVERILEIDEPKRVRDMSLAEITSIPYRDQSMGLTFVPTFAQFVDTMAALVARDSLKFMVELDFKPHEEDLEPAVSELIKVVNQMEFLYGDTLYHYFYVGTFYPNVLKAVRERSDKIVTAFAVNSAPPSHKFAARMAIWFSPMFVRKNGCAGIEPYQCMVDAGYVKRWQRRNCFINAWTANLACEKEYLSQFPIAFTTNCPGNICEPDPSDLVSVLQGWCKKCNE